MALRRGNKNPKNENDSSEESNNTPRRSKKESGAPMSAASNIDNEKERVPPGMGRNAGRGIGRKQTFGTGSRLNIPKNLSIDIDDVTADVDEHSE